jgi:hypothetical protein
VVALCPHCGGPLHGELDELLGEPVRACLACGERIWLRVAPVGDLPRRTTTRARPGESGDDPTGRRLLFAPDQVAAIEAALAAGVPLERVARRFGCAYETIRRIRAGQYS